MSSWILNDASALVYCVCVAWQHCVLSATLDLIFNWSDRHSRTIEYETMLNRHHSAVKSLASFNWCNSNRIHASSWLCWICASFSAIWQATKSGKHECTTAHKCGLLACSLIIHHKMWNCSETKLAPLKSMTQFSFSSFIHWLSASITLVADLQRFCL